VGEQRTLRRAFFVLTLTLLLASMFKWAFIVQPVKAAGTIYIKADGSIQGTDKIVSSNNVTYIFTDNINDYIVVQRSNITINGNSLTLQGSGAGDGFSLSNVENVTIANTTIQGFNYGIHLNQVTNSRITGNIIQNNNYYGVWLYPATNTTIANNSISFNQNVGITLADAVNNTVIHNNMTGNRDYCIYFYQNSDNNIISANLMGNSQTGIYVVNDTNNKITDNDFTNIDSDGINFAWGLSNLVRGNSITKCSKGIFVGGSNLYTSNFTLENNTISGPSVGIELSYTTGNKIVGNRIGNATAAGCHIIASNNITVARNMISNSSSMGIQLSSSSNDNVTENLVTACGACGIYTDYGSSNRIIGNNVTWNLWGINVIASSNDYIYHNCFVNNTHQADTYLSGVNYWDNGYPLPQGGGNYWSDFKARYPSVYDNNNGISQNITGGDTIWDGPYVIDANNKDNYPLVGQPTIPELSTFFILPLFVIAALLAVIVYRRKRLHPAER
jgi:parallel beta-helix repeat protein